MSDFFAPQIKEEFEKESVKRLNSQILPLPEKQFVGVFVGDQLFGFPVLKVQDVLKQHDITPVPCAHPEIVGALNLRGRIATAIDVRICLGLPALTNLSKTMHVVVTSRGELYSLLVDRVWDVLNLPDHQFEPIPSTLDPLWRRVSSGIYRMKKDLFFILNVDALLDYQEQKTETEEKTTAE